MTTSRKTSLTRVESLEDTQLSTFELGYLKAAAQDQAYEAVFKAFEEEHARDSRITRAFVARRLGKDPAQITKFLGAPGNWTLETFAQLLAALGRRATFGSARLTDDRWANHAHPLTSLGTTETKLLAPRVSTKRFLDARPTKAQVQLVNVGYGNPTDERA